MTEIDFSKYIEHKLQTDSYGMLQNMDVTINGKKYLMNFYTITTKQQTLNLFSPIANKALNNKLNTNFNEEIQIDQEAFHYIAVYVESLNEIDCLQESSLDKTILENYLVKLMSTYQRIGSTEELNFITSN